MGHVGGLSIAPHMYAKVGFDPLKGFAPVTVLADYANEPYKSVAELQMPEVIASCATVGFDARTGTPEQLLDLIKKDLDLWGPIVKSTGATAQ